MSLHLQYYMAHGTCDEDMGLFCVSSCGAFVAIRPTSARLLLGFVHSLFVYAARASRRVPSQRKRPARGPTALRTMHGMNVAHHPLK